MAGATNKSAKRHGYSNRQIETARASGTVLSLAALQKHAGEPSRPTKHHKALAADMAARKAGLQRKVDAPAGWQKAARGEGADERAAATAARSAFLQKREAARLTARRPSAVSTPTGKRLHHRAMMATLAAREKQAEVKGLRARLATQDVQRGDTAGAVARALYNDRRKQAPASEIRQRLQAAEAELERRKGIVRRTLQERRDYARKHAGG